MPLLEVNNLKTHFILKKGVVHAVNDVSFEIRESEILGLVGESGSGKSVTSLSINRLVPYPGKTVSGSVLFKGDDILQKTKSEMERIRGKEISMIFQDPVMSLNPVFTIGNQLIETIRIHNEHLNKAECKRLAVKMLNDVGIPSAENRLKAYPHNFSGGMRQRIMIAMALSCNPSLLIADEPTTALDVTIQAQVLELMKDLKEEKGMSILLVTHNLALVAEMADRVCVMYAGKIVEYSDVYSLFKNHKHPYTQCLLNAIPPLDQPINRLTMVGGTVPNLREIPSGCAFHPRCPKSLEKCFNDVPLLKPSEDSHFVACHLYH
jgi:peptide/nickel transport system ATP-binding protein/oligopeptide transport system ATP-binding protein